MRKRNQVKLQRSQYSDTQFSASNDFNPVDCELGVNRLTFTFNCLTNLVRLGSVPREASVRCVHTKPGRRRRTRFVRPA